MWLSDKEERKHFSRKSWWLVLKHLIFIALVLCVVITDLHVLKLLPTEVNTYLDTKITLPEGWHR